IAPPLPVAELLVNVQLSKVTEFAEVSITAPPVPPALFPEKATLVNVATSSATRTAPPLFDPVTLLLENAIFLTSMFCDAAVVGTLMLSARLERCPVTVRPGAPAPSMTNDEFTGNSPAVRVMVVLLKLAAKLIVLVPV